MPSRAWNGRCAIRRPTTTTAPPRATTAPRWTPAATRRSRATSFTAGKFLDVLHRVVGLPTDSDPNRWVMGVIAVLYSLALVSGVVVLLPSLVKDFFALRVEKISSACGWIAQRGGHHQPAVSHHLVALTAVVFAYHDQIYDVQDKLVHQGQWAQAFPRPPATGRATGARHIRTAYTAATGAGGQAIAPGFEPTLLQYQQVTGPRAVVRIWGRTQQPSRPARGGFIAFDPTAARC